MKKLLILLFVLFAGVVVAQDTTKVLFIGNSITYFNNMPETFEAIANSKGDTTEITMYAPGGTGFLHHVNDENVYNHFKQGNWDYVVLQPGSNESPGYSETIESTLERARILKDSILFYNPCAQILYYEISYGVWGNTAENLVTYNNTMDLIRANLTHLSDSTALFFAPAGEAMRTAWNSNQNSLLWNSNGDIHPNAKGSYIIACSFYASIFQKSSFGTNVYTSLSQEEAEGYQTLADTTVLNHLSDWRINTFNQHTDFNFSINGLDVNFESTSSNIDSLHWMLNGDVVSTEEEFTHTFPNNMPYTIELITYNNGCSKKRTKLIELTMAALKGNTLTNKVKVYPNPFNDYLIVKLEGLKQITLFDIRGKDCTALISYNKIEKGIKVNTSALKKGSYMLYVNGNPLKIIK